MINGVWETIMFGESVLKIFNLRLRIINGVFAICGSYRYNDGDVDDDCSAERVDSD